MQLWQSANQHERLQWDVISRVFRNDQYLMGFFFDPNKPRARLAPVELLREARDLSSGEELLVKVALDIWSGAGNAKIWQLIERLDESNFCAVLEALAYLRILANN